MSNGALKYIAPLFETEALLLEPGPQVFGVRGRTFTVAADLSALRSLCAATFARPDAGSSAVTPSAGQVSFDDLMITIEPPGSEGSISARCLSIRVPVSTDQGPAQFCPFAFTDDPRVLAWLREVLGVPALLADINAQGLKLEVRTSALEAGSDVVDHRALLVQIDWATDLSLPTGVQQEAAGNVIQLKQMRDAVSPDRACVQDLVTGNYKMNAALGSSGGGTLVITPYVSLALDTVLGLGSSTLSFVNSLALAGSLTIDGLENARLDLDEDPWNLPFVNERPGDPQVPPPYRFRSVTISGYRLQANSGRLHKLCDEYLNHPFPDRPYKYVPATRSVFIEHLHYGAMSSLDPPPGVSSNDKETQRELVLRVLVARVDEDGLPGLGTDPRVFCPFICVDSGWSLVSGREVLGYPKLRGVFNPQSVAVEGKEIIIASRPFAAPPPGLLIDAPGWLWGPLDLQSPSLHPDSFLSAWLSGNTRGYGTVQLKQIRSAENPGLCRDQELIWGEYTLHGLEITLPSVPVELELDSRLADSLGLSSAFHLIAPGSWYHVNCGFDLRMQDPLTL